MVKHVNYIVYLPGYAGTFLSYLLSLDQHTYPLNVKTNDIKERINSYSYKQLRWKYGNWEQYHIAYPRDYSLFETFIKQEEYQILNFAVHPWQFKGMFKRGKSEAEFSHTIVQVYLEDDLEYIIQRFKSSNNNFPKTMHYDIQDNIDIFNEHNPYQISLKNIFKGKETFIVEYKKLATHLNFNIYESFVLDLYKDWYKERGLHNFKIE